MCPTGGETAIRILLDSAEKSASIPCCTVKRPRNQAGLIFVAETEEAVVFVGVLLIETNVEVVAVLSTDGIREIVEAVPIHIGLGIELGNRQGQGIKLALRDDVERHSTGVVLEGNAASVAGVPRIENLSHKSRMAPTIGSGRLCKVKLAGEVSSTLGVGGNQRRKGLGLPNPQSLV